jgi:hypothetical protein
MSQQLSQERKAAYYIGTGLMVIGGLLFISVFISGALHFGDFSNFEENTRSSMFRAIAGMVLLIVGGGIKGIAARGLAGSGVVLDPGQAREDLEPYSRMAGGMLKDALDEAGVNPGEKPGKVIMLKCPACGKLSEENANFCQACGKKL